jgi:DNA (cytosine-5)-methyltransferase 1
MSIGLQEAARRAKRRLDIPLAIDSDAAVAALYKVNLAQARVIVGDASAWFDGKMGADLTPMEHRIKSALGSIDVLLGGPPCQGHSDLNNHTRRDDPKNVLYLLMARAAEVLQPRVVVVENVAPVLWDKSGVVGTAKKALEAAGYSVDGQVLDLRRVGVPQRRRRYVLLASKVPDLRPDQILKRLATAATDHPDRTVSWAIRDLLKAAGRSVYDTASRPTKANEERIKYLFEHRCYDLPNAQRPECHRDREHSYVSMYGRLRWDKPAQTITTGFGSMGQGRYVHPGRRRTITPHEAARLQTFPDWFDFEDSSRGVLAKVIGNAVPPLLMVKLGSALIRGLSPPPKRARRRA